MTNKDLMKKVILGKPQWLHWQAYRRWINQPAMMRLLDRRKKVSEQEHRLYVRKIARDPRVKFFGIFLPGKEFIGVCALKQIDKAAKKAELYICLSPGASGHGYGLLAVKALLAYGFEKLKLNRIYLYTPAYNTAALRCYHKAGFVQEGRLLQDIVRNGRTYDAVRLCYLKKFRRPSRRR